MPVSAVWLMMTHCYWLAGEHLVWGCLFSLWIHMDLWSCPALSTCSVCKHTRGLANTTHPLPSDTGKGFQIRLHQTEERPGSPYGGVQPRVFSLLHIPWWSLLFPTRLLRARLTRQKLINSWNAHVALKSEVGNTQVGPYTCVGSGLLTDLSVDSIQ